MNDFKKDEIQSVIPYCPKCNSQLADTAAVFWNKENTKIIEHRAYCSNRTCDYVLVKKYE